MNSFSKTGLVTNCKNQYFKSKPMASDTVSFTCGTELLFFPLSEFYMDALLQKPGAFEAALRGDLDSWLNDGQTPCIQLLFRIYYATPSTKDLYYQQLNTFLGHIKKRDNKDHTFMRAALSGVSLGALELLNIDLNKLPNLDEAYLDESESELFTKLKNDTSCLQYNMNHIVNNHLLLDPNSQDGIFDSLNDDSDDLITALTSTDEQGFTLAQYALLYINNCEYGNNQSDQNDIDQRYTMLNKLFKKISEIDDGDCTIARAALRGITRSDLAILNTNLVKIPNIKFANLDNDSSKYPAWMNALNNR